MLNKYKIIGDILIVYNRKDNREMLFDTQDFDRINKHTWCIADGYVNTTINLGNGKSTSCRAHRFVMNNPANLEIDHENGIKTDNRKSNLIVSNHQQNQHNHRKAKGYSWVKRDKKYQAKITIDGKSKHLGYYDTEHEARAAYLEAKKKYHPTAPIHLYT